MRWPPTVQGWQNLVLSIMVIVVLAGGVAVAVLFARTDDVTRALTFDVQPARIAAYQLQGALRDQETAVRGYAITANPLFLEPYFKGRDLERDTAQEIRDLVGYRPELIGDLDAVEQGAAAWRESYVEPLIAAVAPGRPAILDAGTAERGKAEFDVLRSMFDVQNRNLLQARQDAVAELEQIRLWRNVILAALAAMFLLATVLLAVLVRTAVTRPLSVLAAACRKITDGSFDEKIVPRGPRDIRAIATDVEDMRQRIVEELESTRSARAQLADQALELQRSNSELEQFAYVASHDLQEPLRKVASFCQLLEKRYGDQLDGRGKEYIGFAVDGAKRMQVLINDLLTFSRVGRLNSTEAQVSLDDALDDALANLATAIDETEAEIVRKGQLPQITGDPTLLTMLWQNLIGNAMKFRRDGVTPRIVIDCEVDSDERGGSWLITVTDNGIGISEEFADKVFVLFQRLHGRDVYTGTGIGLALCKKIVEHHGGGIWIDTDYTDGARFRFTIPVADPVAAGEPAAAALEGDTA
ncbi:sensor histidine kinase [Mycolicibacterium sp. XJ1819]